jgi:hypothetical protein
MNPTPNPAAQVAAQIASAADGDVLTFSRREIGLGVLDLIEQVPVTKHPLGFFHFELTEALALPIGRVRLHIWTAASLTERDEEGMHHAHTWSLASCVLSGSLRDTSYEAIPNDDGKFTEVEIYYPADLLRSTGVRHTLRVVRELDVPERHVYRLDPGIPHKTEITSLPTATLVVARESGSDHTSIYRGDGDNRERSAMRPSARRDEVVAALSEVLIDGPGFQ